MRKYDVIALGELLIDFSNRGIEITGNPMFAANPGGAPCNVLAMLQKLGKSTAFVGKVGSDFFGDFLKNTIMEQGIDASGLVRDDKIPTTLAFVNNAPNGERSFSFYRNPGADMMLREEEIDLALFEDASIFHFGTLSMTNEGIEKTTKKAIKYAKSKEMLISFDPNLRELLWDNLEHAKEMINYGMSVCDILKISDNEICFVTGTEDVKEGIDIIKKKYHPTLICATMGTDGSMAIYKELCVKEKAFIQENTIDTTGAGDTFMGCVLNYVIEVGINNLNESELKKMLTFANAAASIITTRSGALKVMPSPQEIRDVIVNKKDENTIEIKLNLGTIDRVKNFVSIITRYDADFLIRSDRYIVDAKSIMGIFSLDLSKPLLLEINGPQNMSNTIIEELDEYIV